MYTKKKTEYQKGYEDGEELIAKHVNNEGKPKAKEYIKKLVDKNKGKTDALNWFVDNSASYFVPPQFLSENKRNKTNIRMKTNKVRLTESRLKRIIRESISQILEYNEDFLQSVENCDYLSPEDKRLIQIASMNNWDRHEREEKKKQEISNLETLANHNIHDRRIVRESWGRKNQEDVMDAIIMLKEAYFDLQEFTKLNRTAGLDLSEAMGNLRGAIKILNNIEKIKDKIAIYYNEEE